MVLRKQLDKDPQFQVALELVQDKGMYNRIITPADAKVSKTPGPVMTWEQRQPRLLRWHRYLIFWPVSGPTWLS